MNLHKKWFPIAIVISVMVGSLIVFFFSKPVLASTNDDVQALTQIVMNEGTITGASPRDIALEERRLADTVTVVGATGLVKHVQKDAILAQARKEPAGFKFSLAVSDIQVHVYGDTAVVTYQRELKQVTSSEDLLSKIIGHPFSCMDTFIKRNGEWKKVATAAVSQSPIPDELYKAAKAEAAQW